MPGVEIQATIFLNLIRGDWLTRVPFKVDLAFVILTGLLFGVGLARMRPLIGALVAIAGIIAITFVAKLFFMESRQWFSWVLMAGVQIPVAASWAILFNTVSLFVQKRLMEQSLSMYVSPHRAKQIIKNPKILQPGAEKQEVSIIFSDIANFTSMSEGMDSDELAKMMNRYFDQAVDNCLHRTDGTVVKFIGDAIFAIWNAPEPQLAHQELACRGALLLRDQVTDFQFNKPGLEVRTRIGVHTGVANVGNFGSRTRIDYTAIGENINLASRMEGLNKYLGTDVLITGDVNTAVKGKFVTRFCGLFQLKGFERAVEVHELLAEAGPEEEEKSRAWREAYAEALKTFQSGDWASAEAGLHCVIKMRGKDGPSEFLLKHIKEHSDTPPAPGWDGVVELKEK
jgi:adenylate cyclase